MTDLQVRNLNPAVGAEIEGLVPAMPLDDETVAQSVLVFRDLDIDEDFQRYLVYTLIREEPPPVGLSPLDQRDSQLYGAPVGANRCSEKRPFGQIRA